MQMICNFEKIGGFMRKKMNIKKSIKYGIYCLLFMGIFALCGCGNTKDKDVTEKEEKKKIICSTFSQYDWVRAVLGENNDNFSISLLMENGGDLHNYQPTAGDMIRISDCDLFIFVGGESDVWVEDAIKESMNQNQKSLKLMDLLGENLKEEEHVEGMEEEPKEEHEEKEYDEHVWLSLSNAQIMVEKIADVIGTMDTTHAEQYRENAKTYCNQLEDLNNRYKEVVSQSDKKVLLFGDRFPFRYLVEDYGLSYYAAFEGCSAETEASFETVAFLSEKIKEYKLSSVLVLENSDKKVADAIIANTDMKDQKILAINSLQSVTKDEIDKGRTYITTMEENLEILKQALS